MYLRVYLPTDDIPDFASTVYTYWGLDDEEAPLDTTKVVIHPSVTTIKEMAFFYCRSLKRVTIPDTVARIESYAIAGCDSLTSIQLPRTLTSIGRWAFRDCKLLRAVYLPSTVTHIGDQAFRNCKSLRCFYLPQAIEVIGDKVVSGCDQLLTTVKYSGDDSYGNAVNNIEVNEWLMQRHANFHLHQVC